MNIMIVVTHLLGTGHLARALVLGRAFAQAGHKATVVSGGMPAAHLDSTDVEVVQLPPLRSDGVNFSRLLDVAGTEVSAETMAERVTSLLATLHRNAPDVLITELFPFGRRVLAPEFTALLDAAKALPVPPLMCCSIRDILAPPSKPDKAETTHQIVLHHYDAVLVHADPDVTPLEASWPVTPDIAQRLAYTGFVANPSAHDHPQALGTGEILVSAGGGSVGGTLYLAVLEAVRLSPDLKWRVLVGGQDATQHIAQLRKKAPSNALLEAARPDFRQILRHAAASVSMCGYNTALDILQAGTPAVFVPFDDGGEVEQSLRAQALSTLDGIAVLRAADATPECLLENIRSVLTHPKRPAQTKGFDGAAQTVHVVEKLMAARQ